jgi:hypothetical protein
MPLKEVEAEIAYVIDGVVIHHAYCQNIMDYPLTFWFVFEGVTFDIRKLGNLAAGDLIPDILQAAIKANVAPFDKIVHPSLQTFSVRRLQDAYVVHDMQVEALTMKDACSIAKRINADDARWKRGDDMEFDHCNYEVLSEDGNFLDPGDSS